MSLTHPSNNPKPMGTGRERGITDSPPRQNSLHYSGIHPLYRLFIGIRTHIGIYYP